MAKEKAKPKRPSNNPAGRPKLDDKDKKVMIGIYVLQSDIDARGGKEAVRKIFADSLK